MFIILHTQAKQLHSPGYRLAEVALPQDAAKIKAGKRIVSPGSKT